MERKVKLPSNRKFGIFFFVVFLLIGMWPYLYKGELRFWSIIISLIFLILGIFNSKFLSPLNKLWMKLGIILGKVVSPLVMGIIFFLVVTPIGLLLRLFRKDVLLLKKNNSDTYWIKKDNKNNNMRNQF